MALGCNIINMGALACFVAYPLFYKPFEKLNKPFLGAFIASVAALQLGSIGVVIEGALSGSIEINSILKFTGLMQAIHLPIGIVEGVLTGFAISAAKTQLKNFAGERFVIDGTNADDLKSYRPGIKALQELNILSPLAKFGITKDEIREFAKLSGIKIYNKPSTPCFATRFPYGTELSETLLNTAKKGEEIIKNYGFENCRFRIHKDTARIEIPISDIEEFLKHRTDILQNLKKEINLKYFTLDLEGLRSGSMDI